MFGCGGLIPLNCISVELSASENFVFVATYSKNPIEHRVSTGSEINFALHISAISILGMKALSKTNKRFSV
jgi:hypothetical protein